MHKRGRKEMTSKADYLKKYLSQAEGGGDNGTKKKKVKIKKRSNITIHDDDVDWRAIAPRVSQGEEEEADPEDAPVVAEFHDEQAPKWQSIEMRGFKPMSSTRQQDMSGRSPHGDSRRHDSPDISPPRKARRHDSPDISPPRKSRRHDSPDISPPRKARRHDSPDISPPRKSRRHDSPDISPPRKSRRHDSPDISPPRSRSRRQDSPDISPPRRSAHKQTTRRDSTQDKPHRKSRWDKSPEGQRSRERDERREEPPDMTKTASPRQNQRGSPVVARRRHDSSDSDLSPPRRGRHDSPEPSPPGRQKTGTNVSSNPRRKAPQGVVKKIGDPKDEERMSSGTRSGLQSAKELKEENALARERRSQFYQELDASMSGRHAETVYRDKSGRRIDPKVEEARKREEEKKRVKDDEQFMEWGRGVAQIKMAHEKVADELYEMSKPLARYADDEDLERMLKERERDGDPMLAFIKKKVSQEQPLKGGRVKKGRPTYTGSFPPNRFGIRPGFRWDGVDRSNGFEKAWFARQANKQASADEAYKWSVEDM